jgi:general secretion pathway protein A
MISDVKQRDYYRVLGIRPDATQTEVNHAYQRMVGRFDLSLSRQSPANPPTLKNKIALLQEAYDTLSDKQKREAHDRLIQGRKVAASFTPGVAQEAPSPVAGKKKKGQNVYRDYFGFSEKPFDLTPDPKYLYLSPKHKEVLAHLVYGLQENNGFLKIIGEVGTGKTTICRSFLRELNTDFNIAYIFNPCINELELLQTINTELGLPATSTSKKILIDILNRFLLEERKKGNRVVVIIDEAQDLGAEVLEQLRLLSNLETETEKLIQIVLIGQPELDRILERSELRQLEQRITIQWELLPLNQEETRGYIQHRLNVALGKGKVRFLPSAMDLVFKFSQGIPRMINVVADRALLIAYTNNTRRITPRIVRQAIADVARTSPLSSEGSFGWKSWALALVALGLVLLAVWRFALPDFNAGPGDEAVLVEPVAPAPSSTAAAPAPAPADEAPVPAEAATPLAWSSPGPLVISGTEPLVTYLSSLTLNGSRMEAVKWVLESWGIDRQEASTLEESDLEHLQDDFDLMTYELNADWKKLTTLNQPAILELVLPSAQGTKFIALMKLEEGRGLFGSMDSIRIPLAALDSLWSRKALILWRDFEGLPEPFGKGYRGKEAIWLQKNLRLLGFFSGGEAPFYGVKTEDAVRQFQRRYGIRDDGRFSAESRIMLYNQLSIYPTPHLVTE